MFTALMRMHPKIKPALKNDSSKAALRAKCLINRYLFEFNAWDTPLKKQKMAVEGIPATLT
ncbi:hypothetical protein [Herminiimonas arsenitoxidans]|uniref:hypothetical protein n=1 Tax=Herminiimonas arsenitoxidans TaxID=1809410 RepID=UPI000970DEDE|nr:hypothetical protein [Herminiimonas arsenitoxidans]